MACEMLDRHVWDIKALVAVPQDLHLKVYVAARKQVGSNPVEPRVESSDLGDYRSRRGHIGTNKPLPPKIGDQFLICSPVHDRQGCGYRLRAKDALVRLDHTSTYQPTVPTIFGKRRRSRPANRAAQWHRRQTTRHREPGRPPSQYCAQCRGQPAPRACSAHRPGTAYFSTSAVAVEPLSTTTFSYSSLGSLGRRLWLSLCRIGLHGHGCRGPQKSDERISHQRRS